MKYPAAPGATYNGKFDDGVAGVRAPSLDSAAYMNAVYDEIISAIQYGGLTPDEADLTQLSKSLANLSAQPLSALAFPTIATSDNRLAATAAAVAGQGGTVSIPAGVMISLAQEVVAGATGRMRAWTTVAWTSSNLLANATYYLRAQVVGGVLQPYVQQGADADAIPSSQKGVPNAASGGGFDSTQIDILLAKVVTGAAGSLPVVTPLANKALLKFSALLGQAVTAAGDGGFNYSGVAAINWARTPSVVAGLGYDITATTVSSALDRAYISTQVINRYGITVNAAYDIFAGVGGSVFAQVNILGVA